MSVASFPFLAFLACLIPVNYCLPVRWRKWVLLLASFLVWQMGGTFCTLYMLAFTLMIYLSSRMTQSRLEQGKGTRTIVIPVVFLSVVMMMALKEARRFNHLQTVGWITVPLGISYFTFMGIGYLLDVAFGKAEAEKNYLNVLLYCGFFPHLWQGPIGEWREIMPQLNRPARFEPDRFTASFMLLIWGFFKKLVIADRLSSFVASALQAQSMPGWAALITVIAYTISLYTDFSGGVDIVRGAAGMLGIQLAKNFSAPFFASSVSDFWRRWHMSLGNWFRGYVLYPMATSTYAVKMGKWGKKVLGAKVGLALPSAFSAFLVFVMIGLWHALHWNALIYGLWFGTISMAAVLLDPWFKKLRKKLGVGKKTKWYRLLGVVRTYLAVLFAQYFACTTSPAQAFALIRQTLLNFNISSFLQMRLLPQGAMDSAEWAVVLFGVGLVIAADALAKRKPGLTLRLARAPMAIRWPIMLGLIMLTLIFGRYGRGYDPSTFVYAGF